MSSFHVRREARPRVAWAIGYAAGLRLATPAVLDLDALTPGQGALLLHTLDAVCHIAPAGHLAFADFAALDELCAELSDWLRELPSGLPLAA
jgi:hypothetical protein